MNYTLSHHTAQNHAVFSSYEKLVIALPRGRIAKQLAPIFQQAGIIPEAEFFENNSRKLRFSANDGALELLQVRAFDVATYVMGGAAHIGIVGSDILLEHGNQNIYSPVNMNIGHCRLVLAGFENHTNPFNNAKIRIASKYPNSTRDYFAKNGMQAEIIKLNGAIEIAPHLGLADYIVDLVSTGDTLRANQLVEIKTLADVSTRLIVNAMAWKTRYQDIMPWVNRFEEICHAS